jgi:hypothetical protein
MPIRQLHNAQPHFRLCIFFIQSDLVLERLPRLIKTVHLVVHNSQEHMRSGQLWIELARRPDRPFGCLQLPLAQLCKAEIQKSAGKLRRQAASLVEKGFRLRGFVFVHCLRTGPHRALHRCIRPAERSLRNCDMHQTSDDCDADLQRTVMDSSHKPLHSLAHQA